MTYVVTVQGPSPTWVRWKSSSKIMHCWTFERPEPMSLEEAMRLKARADICLGGTLRVVKV